MKFAEAKKLIEFFQKRGLMRVKMGEFEVEFFEPKSPDIQPMALDPVSLSKVFSDQMPPDSAMMFASTEDMPDLENPKSKPLESADMA